MRSLVRKPVLDTQCSGPQLSRALHVAIGDRVTLSWEFVRRLALLTQAPLARPPAPTECQDSL